jgi:hypothetical protein
MVGPFTAAIYMRGMVARGLPEELFILSLARATEAEDLWWQMGALQELGWASKLEHFFYENAERIEASEYFNLRALLAEAQGRVGDAIEHRKEAARRGE